MKQWIILDANCPYLKFKTEVLSLYLLTIVFDNSSRFVLTRSIPSRSSVLWNFCRCLGPLARESQVLESGIPLEHRRSTCDLRDTVRPSAATDSFQHVVGLGQIRGNFYLCIVDWKLLTHKMVHCGHATILTDWHPFHLVIVNARSSFCAIRSFSL